MINTDYMFADFVGQEKAKKQILHFHQHRYQKNRTFENVMLVGGAGNGKTELARVIGRGLYQTDETGLPCLKSDGKTPLPRPFFEVNGSSIKSTAQFINSILIPKVIDKEATLFIDEAHAISHKVEAALLTMTAPSVNNKTVYFDTDLQYRVELDWTKLTLILATTNQEKLTKSMRERFIPIELEKYSNSQLAEIIRKGVLRMAGEVEFEGDVLEQVALTARCNPRDAIFRAKQVKDMITKSGEFGFQQWAALKESLSILPLGLTGIELSILRILHDHPNGITLTSITAQTGLDKEAIKSGFERYLQMKDLMTVTAGKGRTLTPAGTDYLRQLDKEKPLTK